MWLSLYDRIPIFQLLYNRNITAHNHCPFCISVVESACHVLRDCSKASRTWILIGIPASLISSFSLPFKQWLFINYTSNVASSHTLTPWKVLFPTACWAIWKARNFGIYSNLSLEPNSVSKQAISSALDFVVFSTSFSHRNSVTALVGWSPPSLGSFKLNTDGASANNPGPAGAGGVIRNSAGEFVRGFSRNIDITSSYAAELWALRDGLHLASVLNISNLSIEVDAQAIINSITKSDSDLFSQHLSLINDCRALLQQLQSF